MKKILKESITQNQALSLYENMPKDEKISWKKAIEQCINDYTSKSGGKRNVGGNFKFSIIGSVFGVALIVTGIKLEIPELVMMGAGTIAALAGLTAQDWSTIINCAREKKGMKTSDTTDSEMGMNESKKRKTIRLTESELVGLIQRIIKEDDTLTSKTTTKFCQVKTFESLLKEAKQKQKLNFFPQRGYIVDTVEKGSNSMIMNKKITSGMSIKLTDPIKLEEGSEILLKDISDFGQPQLECKGGKPTLYISIEG